jgi:hypothetical protein
VLALDPPQIVAPEKSLRTNRAFIVPESEEARNRDRLDGFGFRLKILRTPKSAAFGTSERAARCRTRVGERIVQQVRAEDMQGG